MGKLMVAAGLAAVAGCAMFAPKTFDGVDMAPGDLEADDLTPLECVRDVPGDPIVVVDRDNVARLPIVYQNKGKCGETAKYLQKAIFEMTGVKPKLIAEWPKQTVTNRPAFFIGVTKAALEEGFEPFGDKSQKFGPATERFRVVAKDGSIYFVGQSRFAVYDWCERQLGVRCYWPDRPCDLYNTKGTNQIYGTSFLKTKGLAVKPVDYEDQPAFGYRENWPYWGDWMAFAKGGNSHRGGVNVHAPAGWNKDTNLVARLPEIFARTEDGQRAVSPLLCYGNPKTLEYYKERIVGEIEHGRPAGGIVNTNKQTITVSQWDCGVACSCDYCRKLFDEKLGNSGSGSPIIWGYFTKQLAKWAKEKYPHYQICILPYINTCDVPPDPDDPSKPLDLTAEGNVEAMLCTMPGLAMLKNDKCKEAEERLIRQWAKCTGNPVLNWHYSCWPGEFTPAPYVYGETISRHYRDMRDTLVGSFVNGWYDARRFQLSVYVWMRCLWNPDVDVHAIYDTFCERMFGRAAKTMRKLIDVQESGWNRQWTSNQCSIRNVYEISYPPSVAKEMAELLNRAAEEAKGDVKALARIEFYRSGFEKFLAESKDNENGTAFVPLMMKKAVSQPTIDGKLDEACWKAAEGQDLVSAWNRTNSVPAYKSTLKVVWTEKGVTFGLKCMEPAVSKMFGTSHGDVWGQDSVEIFMDCANDAAGHFYQLVIDTQGRYTPYTDGISWSPKNVKVAFAPNTDFWTMEVYIPYTELKGFPNAQIPTTSANGCTWSGNVTRWRVGDARTKEGKTPGSHVEMSRLHTRYSGWNKDMNAFSTWVFQE